jgi:hypothetical protein
MGKASRRKSCPRQRARPPDGTAHRPCQPPKFLYGWLRRAGKAPPSSPKQGCPEKRTVGKGRISHRHSTCNQLRGLGESRSAQTKSSCGRAVGDTASNRWRTGASQVHSSPVAWPLGPQTQATGRVPRAY